MKIFSYNVNGIRAALKKGFIDWLEQTSPDIVCLQEIKAATDQFDTTPFKALGYESYWFSAQKKGYSGVGLLTKVTPKKIHYGTGIDYMDHEGRNLQLDFDTFSIMSLYLPSGSNSDRLDFKLTYMARFKDYITTLKGTYPNLLICGDFNICHKAIDIHDPLRNKNVSGFLPVERAWLSAFIDSGFVDTFRLYNPQPDQYSWWSYRANARTKNKGWRLDYILASSPIRKLVTASAIIPTAYHSDHCPVSIELNSKL